MKIVKWLIRLLIGKNLNLLQAVTKMDEMKILAAKSLILQIAGKGILPDLQDAEFKVFSQFGEDGILQYLIDRTKITKKEKIFVEFGVETYDEANTRFLLVNDSWTGLVIDGTVENIDAIKAGPLYWKTGLTAVCSFITTKNINQLISESGISGDIGLLSVDIDGNDYWVWNEITAVNPVIVVAEYNAVFGKIDAVTIPYKEDFVRSVEHYSYLYWGASLAALSDLASEKGYALVGCNSAGNNAFFVRRDRLNGLSELDVAEAYVDSNFKESRDPDGGLTFLRGRARRDVIAEMSVYDVKRKKMIQVTDLV